LRCLDVGTMDGFWAFKLERRGFDEVLASDVLDATRLDHFAADRLRGELFRRSSERNSWLAAELLGSRTELRDLSVYDLNPAEVGEFELVVMGYVLQTAKAMRSSGTWPWTVRTATGGPRRALAVPHVQVAARHTPQLPRHCRAGHGEAWNKPPLSHPMYRG